MSCLSRCPDFRGVLDEGFHCIYTESNLTVGHRRFSDHNNHVIDHMTLESDKMADDIAIEF